MALRVGKRKRPAREVKQFKYALKITDKVLDDQTLQTLAGLLNAKKFKSVDYPVSQGKEAVVFRATKSDGSFVAVKVFKFETTAFRNIVPYMDGDPRFDIEHARHNKRALVKIWARKEFSNLRAAFDHGVSGPKPLALKENIIVMQFVGEGGRPFALLSEVVVQNPGSVLEKILVSVKRLYEAGIVHADLSPFNIMVSQKPTPEGVEEEPVLIDFAQGVSLQHPKAQEFLERDIKQLLKFFSKLGVEKSESEVLQFIKSERV
jgi:RIO kinase 1